MEQFGARRWLISCDESGFHGSPHYGFGSMWMKWQRRGDFHNDILSICENHSYSSEIKWNTVNAKSRIPFYEELITYFFKHRWLVFHCLVVKKESVRKELHSNDWDLARRKHYTMLLTNKMKKALNRFPDREHEFRIHIDKIASRYQKADEAMEVITNNVLNKSFQNRSPVKSVITHDSKDHYGIQICDLILGAVMETWQNSAKHEAKHAVRTCIANHLGWDKLKYDTFKHERKFNIWYFLDTTRQRREVESKTVKLKYPYPS